VRLLAIVLVLSMTAAVLGYVRFQLSRPTTVVPADMTAEDTPRRCAHERMFAYSGRIWRSDLMTLLCACAGIAVLASVLAAVSHNWDIGIDVEAAALQTVAQVIPATIVAVFIAVLGLGFIVAQLVAPVRGSRAVTGQHESRRLRAVVIVGLALLVASLLLSTASESSDRRLSNATALIIATIVYLVGSTIIISTLLTETIDPKRFSDKIVDGARRCTRRHSNNPQFVSEDLYARVRIFRGWLRTVNQIGESRDLQYAIRGTEKLVDVYIDTLNSPSRLAFVSVTNPTSTAPAVPGGRSLGRDPAAARWFADELGRALVRAVESGVSGGTLPRDLSRLLDLFGDCIMKFADVRGSSGRPEARILLERLVEVGLLARQETEERKQWFVLPALRLAELYAKISGIAEVLARREPTSAGQGLPAVALAGWLMVTEAIHGDRQLPKDYLATSSAELSSFAEHLDDALLLAESAQLEPRWDVVLKGRTSNLGRIAEQLRRAG
jgi:hypothetical protein